MSGPHRTALLVVVAILAAAVFVVAPDKQAEASHLCGGTGSPLGPFTITTYEAQDYKYTYARTLELAGLNRLFPDIANFAVPRVETGNRAAASNQTLDGFVPPVILKAIAYNESGWAQASFQPLVNYGEVGPVLSSHDCGYGIMQVTTGMQNITGVPNLDQAMIGTNFAFNIARGAKILADKWNQAPEQRPVIGSRDPKVIENWYYAVWGYNGWAFQNHPLNPAYSPGRAAFSCGSTSDGLGHDKSQYPYQEIILGCVANPPTKGGQQLWAPQEVHLPELGNPAFADPLKVENWNPCAYSSNCSPMDFETPNTSHQDPTNTTLVREDVIGAPSMIVSRDSISLTIPPGGTSAQTTVTVTNAGSGILGFRATTPASWVKVSPSASVALGANLGAKSADITISINVAGLSQGAHSAQIKIESLYGGSRTVTLTVNNGIPDGSLVKGSGPDVYLLQLGLRRHVFSLQNFVAWGFSFANVRTVSDTELAAYPVGQPLLDLFATGGLIQGSGPAVYVMDGGVKRHAVSAEMFAQCGYQWDQITHIPDSLLDATPTGNPLSGVPCPTRAFADQTLLEGQTPGVWVVSGGLRHWAVNADVFLSCGYQWGNINHVTDSTVSAIPQGASLSACIPEESLIRGSGPDVYLFRLGLRRHVVDLNNFLARGYSFSSVRAISDGLLNAIPVGNPLLDLFATGALVKGTAPDVYVMQDGKKRHAVNATVFGGCGYGFDSVVAVPDSVLTSISTGTPLSTSTCPSRSFANGTLLEGSQPGVWVVENGRRRWAVSAEIFLGCGYVFGNLNHVGDSSIAAIPAGSPLAHC